MEPFWIIILILLVTACTVFYLLRRCAKGEEALIQEYLDSLPDEQDNIFYLEDYRKEPCPQERSSSGSS